MTLLGVLASVVLPVALAAVGVLVAGPAGLLVGYALGVLIVSTRLSGGRRRRREPTASGGPARRPRRDRIGV